MLPIQIVASNYRCFDESAPLTLSLDRGFLSFVGPNNSGKSTALRLVYELRQVFTFLYDLNPNLIKQLAVGQRHAVPFLGVHDQVEPFNDSNDRPLKIEISWHSSPAVPPFVDRIALIFARDNPGQFTAEFYCKSMPVRFGSITNVTDNVWQTNGGIFNFTTFKQVFDLLRRCLYIGPYRNAINEGAGTYYDLDVGTSFIKQWDDWKSGGSKHNAQVIKAISNDIRHIFDFDELEINSSNTNKEILVMIDGKQYRLSEVGSGFAQFVIVFGNVAIKRPSFILIDEPELNLHPSLQLDFLTSVARYAEQGIVFSTHSLGLARSVSENVISFVKRHNASHIKPLSQLDNVAEFLGEMSFSAFKELGFDKILLVEGVKDLRVLQQLLRKRNKDHQVVLIPLGGDQLATGGVEAELYEFKKISKNVFALVDSEREVENGEPKLQRKLFAESCKKLGIDCVVTQKRAIENYFSERAIKEALGQNIMALGPFEKHKGRWSKSDNWLIASKLRWEEIEQTDIGALISRI